MHGHNWKVEASFASQELNDQGMVVDFADVMKALDDIRGTLDHTMINDVEPFDKINPTAENLAKWIYDRLKEALPLPPSRVTVYETDTTIASYS